MTFNLASQELIFDVAKAYFSLDGADAALRAAEQALKDARELQRSPEALQGQGLGTAVAVDLARRETAQRRYDLALAHAARASATCSNGSTLAGSPYWSWECYALDALATSIRILPPLSRWVTASLNFDIG